MSKFCVWPLVLLLVIASGWSTLAGETRYVRDELVITVRAGQGTRYRVLTTIRTDTQVEVLERQGRYVRVRTPDGTEGWCLAQYLTPEKPKQWRIDKLQKQATAQKKKIAALQEQLQGVQQQRQQWQQQKTQLQEQLQALQQQNQQLKQKYQQLKDKSADVVALDQRYQDLQSRFEKLQQHAQRLEKENSSMLKQAMLKWFLAGAGVLLLGWFLGRGSGKKRSSGLLR